MKSQNKARKIKLNAQLQNEVNELSSENHELTARLNIINHVMLDLAKHLKIEDPENKSIFDIVNEIKKLTKEG